MGLHELLGHGSGKLFYGGASPNFAKDTKNPLTGEPIASWYTEGQTYDVVVRCLLSGCEICKRRL